MSTTQPDSSSTPSRASTMVRETVESVQAAITPPQSASHSPGPQHSTPPASSTVSSALRGHVQLHETLQEDLLTLEYGKDFLSKRTISEELLCHHSEIIPSYCKNAKNLRNKYKICNDIKEELASLSIMMTSRFYKEEGVEDQIMKLIERVRDHYPLGHYQSRIKDVLQNTVDDQFVLKNFKPKSTIKTNSKEFKEMVLMSRLRLINHKGMLIVCDRLVGEFTRIEASEISKAETDVVTALAYRRIRLSGTSEQSIQSFVAWLEHGRLHYETDKQLYNLYKLAARFRINALSDECLNQLFDMASVSIQEAYAQGSSLQRLLGLGEPNERDQALAHYTPPDSVVKVILDRVLYSEHPPAKLSELVSILLAKHMDLELWEHLKLSIKHQFALQVVGAMVAQREAKAETDPNDGGHIKCENHEEITNV